MFVIIQKELKTTYVFSLDDGFPFRVSFEYESLGQLVDFSDPVLLGGHVLLELVELALKHLNMLQVRTELIRAHKRFLFKQSFMSQKKITAPLLLIISGSKTPKFFLNIFYFTLS